MSDGADRETYGSPAAITALPGVDRSEKRIIVHSAWARARSAILAAALPGPGVVVVTGSPGTGKTALLRDIAESCRHMGAETRWLNLAYDPPEAGAGCILLIDEADRSPAATLELIDRRPDTSIILAALPGFADCLADRPRITFVELPPLGFDEAQDFIRARLAQEGQKSSHMSPAAVARLAALSNGVPRLMNVLAGLAAFIAETEGHGVVDVTDVDSAVALRVGQDDDPRNGAGAEAAPPVAPMVTNGGQAEDQSRSLATVTAGRPPVSAPPRHRWRAEAAGALLFLLFGVAAVLALTSRGRILTAGAARSLGLTVSAPSAPDNPAQRVAASATAATAQRVAANAPASPPSQSMSSTSPAPTSALAPASSSAVPASAPVAASVSGSGVSALPQSAFIRIDVTYARDGTKAAREGFDVARALRAAGYTVGDPLPASGPVKHPAVIFFFAPDRDAAVAIAQRLDGKFGAARLGPPMKYRTLPRPGTIEITVPSR